MPGKLKAKIVAGRHLPVMDRASDLTDAFVEVKFGNTTFKTDVYPKSLNPQWNSEWFKFEVDDKDLQDEPLQITVLDHDIYSANDAIGKVYIDIDPLLCSEAATVISGWLPIYDTIHGIRGEINVLVKVDLFNDLNRFRQSSCGVKFFCTTSIPRCYRAVMVHGFVEELVVNEDPEYQWIDRIRTPRASNEARQRLIFLMSGELQRKIGLKVLEMGGNAVVGYLQCFDLEGESGLVVRAIGTACTLEKISTLTSASTTHPSNSSPSKDMKEPIFGEEAPGIPLFSGPPTPLRAQTFSSFSPSKSYSRQSSSSDTELSLTPKTARIYLSPSSPALESESSPLPSAYLPRHLWPGMASRSTTPPPLHVSQSDTAMLRKSVSFSEELLLAASGMGSGGSTGKDTGPLKALLRQQTQSALEQREYPFFTLTSFPPGFLLHVGGVVSARSVKLLDRIHNPDEPETRDAWWEEIRQEIKCHAKALGCHAVVGYSESTSICEEVCILSASGTAVILSSRFMQDGPLDTEHRLSRQPLVFSTGAERVEGDMGSSISLGFEEVAPPGCGFCHIPYDELNIPFPAQLTNCYCCRRYKVPDVLFTTIDLPTEANITGKGCLIQARLCRTKKKAQGEGNATAISNLLPFLEYELHTQLMNKLKLRGMNALFGMRIQISVGETMLLGLASATGVYLTALPSPGGIQIAGKTPSDITYEQHIYNMQKKINDTIAKNKEIYEVNPPEVVEEIIGSPIPEPRQRSRLFRSHSESSDEVSELDLSYGKKDAFVLEIDDTDAVEDIHALLTDVPTPPGFYSCNTEIMPGIQNWTSAIQMFTSVRVFRLNANLTNQGLNKIFSDLCENLLKSFYFKLRSMVPCCLCHLNFTVAIPEDELIQVAVTAVAMSFNKEQTLENGRQSGDKTLIKAITENDEQLQFSLELNAELSSPNPLSSTKGLSDVLGSHLSARAPSVDYSSFADRCSSWIEQLRLKAHTIRRGSVKTTSSLEKASPLPEGHSRSLRRNRSYSGSSVTVVKMTPLSLLPGAKIIKYLGIINMFFIRETTSLREEGGVSGFLHTFIAEVFAMVRAHVAALGGNAVVSYSMKECVFMENPNKNQAQCLINVSGDAVIFVRESELEATSVQPQSATTQTSNGGEGT
ncbi:C2 domain-containing protein 5-like isoform X1 [Myxocyprinus asiaticus]|uniref:C2 domain-containing protein 5-like isoform X1 n=1 Tax=Myxocyprinus asiaticus TaxID=70543 RepID=UPI002222FE6B|nr:C2 domain-containing protein 5-like isoform X1 [Myxocyprinus asiaticus]XP_051580883.1 C2 domain-containing protein 5-like isoform X1 [Myxocyprinus asiaticus]XP_051580884.1 C2 domain-containing protein 5-like isoform X1 [Myxocyprinus asiaticus]